MLIQLENLAKLAFDNLRQIEEYYRYNDGRVVVNSPMNVLSGFKGDSSKVGHEFAYALAQDYLKCTKKIPNINTFQDLFKKFSMWNEFFKDNKKETIPATLLESFNSFFGALNDIHCKATRMSVHSFFKQHTSSVSVPTAVVDIINSY